MVKLVVILGAGASAAFGVPVLNRIFSDNQARRYLQAKPAVHAVLQDIIWEPRGLTLDTAHQGPTMEDILTMLTDWERASTRDPSIPAPPSILELRRSLYCLIQRAVFESKSTTQEHLNPLIDFCRQRKIFDQVTWASFNWDCIFESSFYYSSDRPWPAGLRRNPRVAVNLHDWKQGSARHLFLKLHGGINWWMIDGKLTYLPFGATGNLKYMWSEYEKGNRPDAEPVILEPSFYKYTDSPAFKELVPQWQLFFNSLKDADFVIIIGYSLPDLDTYARETIFVAFQINPNCKWLVVDPSPQVCERYSKILGHSSASVREETLTSFSNDLEANVRVAFPGLP